MKCTAGTLGVVKKLDLLESIQKAGKSLNLGSGARHLLLKELIYLQ